MLCCWSPPEADWVSTEYGCLFFMWSPYAFYPFLFASETLVTRSAVPSRASPSSLPASLLSTLLSCPIGTWHNQIQPLSMEMSRLTRDGTAEPVSRDQILRHARGQGNNIFPVQLTTSRIGNLTRLIHTLLYVMTIHTYILYPFPHHHPSSSVAKGPK